VSAQSAPTSCPSCGASGTAILINPDGAVYCYRESRYTSGRVLPSTGETTAAGSSGPNGQPEAGWYQDPWGSTQRRWWNGSEWGVLESSVARSRREVNALALAVVAVGAFTVLIGVFLPEVESTGSFSSVSQNSMVQTGDGLLALGLAIAAASTAFWAWRRGTRNPTALILGCLIVLGLFAYASSDQLKLYPLDSNGNPDTSKAGEQANPGIGIWVTGVGGGIIALGGLWIVTSPPQGQAAARRRANGQGHQLAQLAYQQAPAGPPGPPGPPGGQHANTAQPSPVPGPEALVPNNAATRSTEADLAAATTKKCPDCAETIKADARVCRFCGYRFVPAGPESPATS
jgi:Uncharacterised protein family UPF0547